jgi:hypothetical protein
LILYFNIQKNDYLKSINIKVYNREFYEIDKINNSNSCSILYMVYNPVNDELLTCDSEGIKVWSLVCDTGFNLMMANYKLILKYNFLNKKRVLLFA